MLRACKIPVFENNKGFSYLLVVFVLKKKGLISRLEANKNECFVICKLNNRQQNNK